MPRFRLVVEYDGTDFLGWQRNPGQRTVQGTLMRAVAQMASEDVVVQGASRTDAGVHALGQVAAFTVGKDNIEASGWRKGLNAILPRDVAVRECHPAPDDWNPRHLSAGKHYRYAVLQRRVRAPLHTRTAWWRRGDLDLEAMREAGAALVGEHDFSSFRASSCSAKTARRRVDSVDVALGDASLVLVDVRGNAFLQHMVRIIVGTLVEIGTGRRAPRDMHRLLSQGGGRGDAGPTVPARGLCLLYVVYSPSEGTEERRMSP